MFYKLVPAFAIMGLIILLLGCSWIIPDKETQESGLFQEGLTLYENKDYPAAIRKFRQLPPDSHYYQKAIDLIQKVPMDRAQSAFSQKQYTRALREIDKINEKNKDYAQAQQLKNKIHYLQALERYQNSTSPIQRVENLRNLNDVAQASRNQMNMIQSMELIGNQFNEATEIEEVHELLSLLEQIANQQQDPEILQLALEQSFIAFNQFKGEPNLRNTILKIIATVKNKLP